MPMCYQCDRWFNTYVAWEQHVDNSPAHQDSDEQCDWECLVCDRSFSSEKSLQQHCSNAYGHPYCVPCKRLFQNENNLMQHMHSRIHVGASIECPWCKVGFATAAGITIHLESGRCSRSGLDRHQLNNMIRNMDRNNIITKPMITLPGYDNVETIATERSWNGRGYECYLCQKQFSLLSGLNNHIRSPAHEQNIYHCPKMSCNREYKLLSGLIQHVESESCGVMRFSQVQNSARKGVDTFCNRLIMSGR